MNAVQIVILGSDGRQYAYLAKPKDDLRKDHRMMEVAGVLNRLFAKEPASRRRNLYIRRHGHAREHSTACIVWLLRDTKTQSHTLGRSEDSHPVHIIRQSLHAVERLHEQVCHSMARFACN